MIDRERVNIMLEAMFRKASLSLKALLLGALIASAPLLALADDTDIYNNKQILQDFGIRPNVLLVLDTSGSMKDQVSGSDKSRLEVMQDVLKQIVNDESLHGQINVGLARFNDTEGSIIYPVVELNKQNAAILVDRLTNHMIPEDWTPIIPAMFEGVRYMLGMPVDGGLKRRGSTNSVKINQRISHKDSITGGEWNRNSKCLERDSTNSNCVSESWTGNAEYISPITNACQPNHLVVLTDGEANRNGAQSAIRSLIGGENPYTCTDGRDSLECANDLAKYLHSGEHTLTIGGEQVPVSIITHTIAFDINYPSMEAIAKAGGGEYFPASDAAALSTAFTTLFDSFVDINTTFAAPSATVNQFNRLNHLDDVYFAVFRPGNTVAWPGNIKKYKLATTRTTIEGDDGESTLVNTNIIVDQDDKPAVDDETGFFLDTSRDFWSTSNPAEFAVTEGGAANKILTNSNAGSRKVYTWFGENNGVMSLVSKNNNAMTKDKLGIAGESDGVWNDLRDWIAGIDVMDWDKDGITDEYRKELGDPLHSRPVVVTYGKDGNDNPKLAMFFGTNDGYFRVIDAGTGREHFSFVPEEMWADMNKRRMNPSGNHLYGVDGAATVWIKDVNNDGTIDKSEGDHVYVYFGFRRGGSSYYALDVTDLNNPKVLWRIQPTGDFAELGQSWSKPIKTKIRYDKESNQNKFDPVELDVLIFAGGYDTNQDNVDTNIHRREDSKGRAIYVVNAKSGALLWKVDRSDESDMKYSIPATMSVADTDLSGHADQMYVGDMGGQVWRFDINNDVYWNGSGQLPQGFITGQVIAKLAADNSNADARRFYQSPDVALIKENNIEKVVLTIGSGYRARPNELGVQDRFYMLKVGPRYGPLANFTTLTHDQLLNVTSEFEPDQAQITNGWWFDLENEGEKVLSTPLIVDGKVIFTTYEPTAKMLGCTVQPGTSREYVVNLLDGSPVFKVGEIASRSRELKTGTIIDEPVIIFTEHGGGSTFLGTEKGSYEIDNNRATRTFWYEKQ